MAEQQTLLDDGEISFVEAEVLPEPVRHLPPSEKFISSSPPPVALPVPSRPPIVTRQILAVALLVMLCDLTIYRGHGFAGCAVLFLVAPLLLALGAARFRLDGKQILIATMLVLLSAKLLWLGSSLLVFAGFALLVSLAMALSGHRPYILELAAFAGQSFVAGAWFVQDCRGSVNRFGAPLARLPWLSVILPAAALVVFGGIFILANPDLVSQFSQSCQQMLNSLGDWLTTFSPLEIIFWMFAAWISMGLLRPVLKLPLFEQPSVPAERDRPPAAAPLYSAFRNTLIAVIGLFAAYLAFEFATLWFRQFPEGFYYAGYAHEGAAWLTVALALATLVLSLVFRGRVLRDERLPMLKKLAWIWSFQNFILAAAVFNRMFIYIDFNGMTRMRVVGLFGIFTVVCGFMLVIWKIKQQRNFLWLVRQHLWTLAFAIYLFALTPVDTLVHRYNVRRIMAGELAPVVQITEHPVSTEGILVLSPLLDCENEIIREGMRAMLADREMMAAETRASCQLKGWTTVQLADQRMSRQFSRNNHLWSEYQADDQKRTETWERFREYAYQWY